MGSATWLMSSSLVMHRPVVSLASFSLTRLATQESRESLSRNSTLVPMTAWTGSRKSGQRPVDAVAEAALCELFDGFR